MSINKIKVSSEAREKLLSDISIRNSSNIVLEVVKDKEPHYMSIEGLYDVPINVDTFLENLPRFRRYFDIYIEKGYVTPSLWALFVASDNK